MTNAMDKPVRSIWNRSPTMAGPSVRIDRQQPVKNRNAISMGMFTLKAEAIKQQSARRFPMWKTGSRPNLSDSGAMKNGPSPSPSSQIVTSKVRSSALCEWNSCKICGAVGVIVIVEKTLIWSVDHGRYTESGEERKDAHLTKPTHEIANTISHFCIEDQFKGFSGSFSS